MTPHLSSLELDALALGALDDVAARRAEEHLQACAACRAEAAALRESHAHFTTHVLPRTLPALRARAAPWWSRRLTWIAAPVLAAAAALVMITVGTGPAPDGGDLLVKGGAALQVVVRRGDHTAPVAAGATLAAGDEIRFVVATPRAGYLLIASVDGRGATTVYHPYGGSQSAPVAAAARLELPGSIRLDDAPGPERVVALWSSTPLPARAVTDALAAIGAGGADAIRSAPPLAVGADEQRSLVFEKAP